MERFWHAEIWHRPRWTWALDAWGCKSYFNNSKGTKKIRIQHIIIQHLSWYGIWLCDIYLGGGSMIFLFLPLFLGRWSNLTILFQMGWFNRQLDILSVGIPGIPTEKVRVWNPRFLLTVIFAEVFKLQVLFSPKSRSICRVGCMSCRFRCTQNLN